MPNVPKRLFTTVPDYVAEFLEQRAEKEGRSVSSLIAFILEESAKQDLEQAGEFPSAGTETKQ